MPPERRCMPRHLCIWAWELRPVLRNPKSLAVAWMDGWSPDSRTHGVERVGSALITLSSAVLNLPYYSHPLPVLCSFIGMNPVWPHFMSASCTQKTLVSGCSHFNIVNQMLQIRHIRYQQVAALSSPIVQITADKPDIRCPISTSVWH